jgi:hypothetical protein
MRTALITFGVLAALSGTARAQWLTYPTPGIARLASGQPNLSAPAPRAANGKPDLSGQWQAACGFTNGCAGFFDLAIDLEPAAVQMTPWAAAIQKQRVDRDHIDDPYGYCLPMGVPRMTVSAPFKMLVTPGVTAMLAETAVGMVFRQVFTDGRPLPTVIEPTWLGYSIGRWDGDVFVVESTGFRDAGWLDTRKARPHSDALRVTERFHRTDLGHIALTVTIDDPKAYLKPWTAKATLNLMADTELIESFCDTQTTIMAHWAVTPPPPEPHSPSNPSRQP